MKDLDTEKKQASLQAFNAQAEAYDQDACGSHARALYPFMLEKIIHLYGSRVLDLGCGTGALLEQVLCEEPDRRVTGLDLSPAMLAQAKRRLGGRAQLVQGDSEALPFPDCSFDLVYCNDSFHHYPAPGRVAAEVARVLAPGGTFLVGDCYQSQPGRALMNFFLRWSREGDVRLYSRREICGLLSKEFHAVEWRRVGGHAFLASGVR